jgi:hypothetical protein
MADPTTVKIRCGHCRRIRHEVTERNYMQTPQSRRPGTVTRAAPMREPPELSLPPPPPGMPPGMRVLETAPGHGGRLKYRCHPRCGRVYTVTFQRYTRAIEAARDNGRDEVLLGVDL